jgi:Ala-tRNA(Pro) deacylase
MSALLSFLGEQQIHYQRFDHPAVFTCEEADRIRPDLPGARCKNLFLRDRKGQRHFLLVVPADKPVDLKSLQEALGSTRLSLGSAARLQRYLQVLPGAVSILALHNDPDNAVELIIDSDLWQAEAIQAHPLVNTSTLVILLEGVKRLLEQTGHVPQVVRLSK